MNAWFISSRSRNVYFSAIDNHNHMKKFSNSRCRLSWCRPKWPIISSSYISPIGLWLVNRTYRCYLSGWFQNSTELEFLIMLLFNRMGPLRISGLALQLSSWFSMWIERGGPLSWPPGSRDLTTYDDGLWSFLKENISMNSILDLKGDYSCLENDPSPNTETCKKTHMVANQTLRLKWCSTFRKVKLLNAAMTFAYFCRFYYTVSCTHIHRIMRLTSSEK